MREWFSHAGNTRPLILLILFVTFCLIVLWVYGSRKRGARLEEYKHIPFLDEADEVKDDRNGRSEDSPARTPDHRTRLGR